MMKELLVMVSEEFRKEYHDTTGKIYRNLKSSVESLLSITSKLSKIVNLQVYQSLVVISFDSTNYKME